MNEASQPPAQPKPKLLDRVRQEIRTRPGHILKSTRSARPLKKAQTQGRARCEARGVLRVYVAASRERANAADGPFSAARHKRFMTPRRETPGVSPGRNASGADGRGSPVPRA